MRVTKLQLLNAELLEQQACRFSAHVYSLLLKAPYGSSRHFRLRRIAESLLSGRTALSVGFEILSGVLLMICPVCNQEKTIETRSATDKPYSRIIRESCGCGFAVFVRPVFNLDKIVSSYPLAGYDREAVRERLTAQGILVQ